MHFLIVHDNIDHTKKNHEKISTQYKAVVYWMVTVFSPKMPLFFMAILISSHTATAPLDLGMKYLWFWGPQTYYYLNLRGQVNLWYSHFHQEQHMRQHCDLVTSVSTYYVLNCELHTWRCHYMIKLHTRLLHTYIELWQDRILLCEVIFIKWAWLWIFV